MKETEDGIEFTWYDMGALGIAGLILLGIALAVGFLIGWRFL